MADDSTASKLPNNSIPDYGNEIPWTVAFSLQFLFSIIGNVLILIIIYKDNRLKTMTNYLVANMAVSDLLGALTVFPRQIVSLTSPANLWRVDTGDIGTALCKLFTFTVNSCFIVSINSCVFIAIDRYFAVAHPHSRPFRRKMKHIITGIWISTLILSSPTLFYLDLADTNKSKIKCVVSSQNMPSFRVYNYFILVLTSCLPSLVVIVAYTLTVYKLYRHKVPGLPNLALKRREHQNKKVLKMAVTIVVLLYLCHGSWLINSILVLEAKIPLASLNLTRTFGFVLYFSLCYNFFIYLVFNGLYREDIKTLISKYFCCSSRSKRTYAINSLAAARAAVVRINERNAVI